MARIDVDSDRILVKLSRAEKLGGLSGDITVPASAVAAVELVDDAYAAVRGLRVGGTALPARLKLGRWRHKGRKLWVAARKGQPGLRLTLTGHRYDELVLGMDDARVVEARIDRLVGGGA